jgi:hypothetical protein
MVMKINIPYISLRLVRHFMPSAVVRFILDNQLILRPGLETRAPQTALTRYLQVLEAAQFTIQQKRVLVFGYGGTFTVGCAFLAAGARHVTLIDYFVKPNQRKNLALLPDYDRYLQLVDGKVLPRPEYLSVINEDVRKVAINDQLEPVDLIISSSVFEHLDDVDGITQALSMLTQPDGIQLHFIDLRDHFFKYPFEMLTFSENTWKKWLNPTSHLNRYRLPDYERVFGKYFAVFECSVLERDPQAFRAAKSRIRSEFLTGDSEVDAVTSLQVLARSPYLSTKT